jgi:hypothetical protein
VQASARRLVIVRPGVPRKITETAKMSLGVNLKPRWPDLLRRLYLSERISSAPSAGPKRGQQQKSFRTPVDFVGLEIASSRRKNWRADAHLGRAFR